MAATNTRPFDCNNGFGLFDRTRSGRKDHGPGGIGATMNDLSRMTPFTNKFLEQSGTVEMSNFKA